MRKIVLAWEQFEPVCGDNIKWSEMIIKPLLELMAFTNAVWLHCRGQNLPSLYECKRRGMVTYLREPPDLETFNGIAQVLRDGGGDCFPSGTLMLGEGMALTPVEAVEAGQKVWGLNDWSTVEAKTFKGRLKVDAIHLNNGSTVSLTPDHHVYVLRCPKHKPELKTLCACSIETRVENRIRVSELRVNDVMTTPARLPFGSEDADPERTLVEGLFISDGWSDQSSRFAISGQDGSPKEKQKREVERICKRLNLHTRWHRKYIAVNDRDWACRMQLMGDRAPNKHVLSINLNEANAAALLRGIMADSGKNTNGPGRTFTTTSRQLATQVRVLHKMFGLSAGYRYVEDHGGLGTNPIHRLGIRGRDTKKLLRVKAITRGAFSVPCWDIQTSDNRVYLPEHDVTVSQCDDLTAWRVAELRVRGSKYYPNGEPAQFVIIKFEQPGKPLMYHILVRRAPTPEHPDPLDPALIEDPSAACGMPT